MAAGVHPHPHQLEDDKPGTPRHGGQFLATQRIHDCCMSSAGWPVFALAEGFDEISRVASVFDSQNFRVLLTALAITTQHARLRGCWSGGALLRTGQRPESAARQGDRVSTNVFVRDLDIALPRAPPVDARRSEVVADGLLVANVHFTQPRCHHSTKTIQLADVLQTNTVLLSVARRRKERTDSAGRGRSAANAVAQFFFLRERLGPSGSI